MAAHLTAHYGLAERTLDFESIPSVSFEGGRGADFNEIVMLGGYKRNLQFVITPELCGPLSGDVLTKRCAQYYWGTHSRVIAMRKYKMSFTFRY